MKNEDIELILNTMQTLKPVTAAPYSEPKLEGISFRYKTVQFHLIDDSFEEIAKKRDTFGDSNLHWRGF